MRGRQLVLPDHLIPLRMNLLVRKKAKWRTVLGWQTKVSDLER